MNASFGFICTMMWRTGVGHVKYVRRIMMKTRNRGRKRDYNVGLPFKREMSSIIKKIPTAQLVVGVT